MICAVCQGTGLTPQAAMLTGASRQTLAQTHSDSDLHLQALKSCSLRRLCDRALCCVRLERDIGIQSAPQGSSCCWAIRDELAVLQPWNNKMENELSRVRCNTAGPPVLESSTPEGAQCNTLCREKYSFHCRMGAATSRGAGTSLQADPGGHSL